MKKGTIVAIIIAVLLIIIGSILLALGLSFAKDEAAEPGLTQRTVEVTAPFEYLVIDTSDCDVRLHLVQTWEEARVELAEHAQTRHTVKEEDEGLKIEMTDHRSWIDRVGVFWEDMRMDVYLPAAEYTNMHIITSTGDIEMPGYLRAGSLTLYTSTGDIYTETEAESVWAESDTGEVAITCCQPQFVHAMSDTGTVAMSSLENVRQITAFTSTGNIDMGNVMSEMLNCESSTGDVSLWLVQAQNELGISTSTGEVYIGNSDTGFLRIETNSGEVEIEDCDAQTAQIKTDTGDVSGYFRTPKWFAAHSDTGKVKVPEGQEGGECRIESDTGNIHFE